MKSDQELFLRTPVKKAVLRMAIPTVISSLVLVIYNMADTFFVGQTHDACQVAAVSLTNAVFVMYMAVANLIGIGGSAVISILLGQKEEKRAKEASAFCFYSALAVGLVAAAVILLGMEPLLRILGSTPDTWEFSRDYLFYIAVGAPFILLANAFGHVVRGEGAASASMLGGMIGTMANIILDPIFILTLDMGTAGAAIATVLGNVFGCVYYIYYLTRKSPLLSMHPQYLAGCGRIARQRGKHWDSRGPQLAADEYFHRAAEQCAGSLRGHRGGRHGHRDQGVYVHCVCAYGHYQRHSAAAGLQAVWFHPTVQRGTYGGVRHAAQRVLHRVCAGCGPGLHR